ncbi:hypothetical protein YZUL1_158 [Citrobacter phage YZU-L1]|nr:hypothetical protein YZUL1_158 [Citrobacter phage YZU-L1]
MPRNLMPKSGAMAPYIVVNRDAAVAGVFSVDGEAGTIVLTSKYLQISNYNLDKQELNTRLSGIDTSINNTNESVSSINESIGGINTALGGINTSIESINTGLDTKAGKGANNDITELNSLTKAITIAQGGTGSSTVDGAKTALELDRFSQDSGTETRVYSGDKSSRLTIQDSGAWGAYSDVENKWISLSVEQGGTGVTNREALWSVVRPQGPTPLSGDPVNDYDAATKRWVQNLINTGTVGPTMNGVMNYGVGDFHLRDSRAYIQPYEVVSDGQLLNRTDWPELWAYAQMLSPIPDAEWLADPEKRGRYSTGNGSTTFRVPDRNGAQPNSTLSLFGRGDGGNSSEDGRVYEAAAPNIYGTAANDTSGKVWQPAPKAVSGAFGYNSAVEDTFLPNDGTFSRVRNNAVLTINAGASDGVYGKYSIKNNILPRSFVGVWVIRASGGFVAANTSWSVNNADAVLPPVNTVVSGGRVSSKYKVGVTDNFSADFYAQAAIGNGITEARVEAHGTNTAVMRFNSNGHLYIPGTLLPQNGLETQSNLVARALFGNSDAYTATIVKLKSQESLDGVRHNKLSHLENSDCTVANYIYTVDGVAQYTWQLTRSDNINLWYSMRADSTMHTPLGQVAIQGSDVRIKDNFKLPKSGAWERIEQIGIVEFTYKGNVVPQRGYLAQQMEAIDPIYVFSGGQSVDDNGKEFEILNVNDKAVMADIITVVQELQKQIVDYKEQLEYMQRELNALRSSK